MDRIRQMIHPKEKRAELRLDPQIRNIRDKIEKDKLLTISATGDTSYILRKACENTPPSKILTLEEYESQYFTSGEQRNNNIKSRKQGSLYQDNQYCGRTTRNLYDLSSTISKNFASEYGVHIPVEMILNIVYQMVIDEPFLEYIETIKIAVQLPSLFPDCSIKMASALEKASSHMDFMVYSSDGSLESILHIVTPGLDIEKARESLDRHKESIEMIYDITPLIVTIVNGQVEILL